jgi:hypothetical protein
MANLGPLLSGISLQNFEDYKSHSVWNQGYETLSILFFSETGSLIGKPLLFTQYRMDSVQISLPAIKLCAIRKKAKTAIAFHNHPSGNSLPSDQDRWTTLRIKAALLEIDCDLLDHFIIWKDPSGQNQMNAIYEYGLPVNSPECGPYLLPGDCVFVDPQPSTTPPKSDSPLLCLGPFGKLFRFVKLVPGGYELFTKNDLYPSIVVPAESISFHKLRSLSRSLC